MVHAFAFVMQCQWLLISIWGKNDFPCGNYEKCDERYTMVLLAVSESCMHFMAFDFVNWWLCKLPDLAFSVMTNARCADRRDVINESSVFCDIFSICFANSSASVVSSEASDKKGLHDCNSPMCTLSQNGYGISCVLTKWRTVFAQIMLQEYFSHRHRHRALV